MEEINFEALVDEYLDEESIMEKIQQEEEEELEFENRLKKNKKTVDDNDSNQKEPFDLGLYAITMDDFLINYLRINDDFLADKLNEDSMYLLFRTKEMTHKDLKILSRDNPFVIGISNFDIDLDDVLKQDCLIVKDCHGNYGTYLNPGFLRDLNELENIQRQLKIISKIEIKKLALITKHLEAINELKESCMYLQKRKKNYLEFLDKTNKKDGFSRIKRFIKKFNNN